MKQRSAALPADGLDPRVTAHSKLRDGAVAACLALLLAALWLLTHRVHPLNHDAQIYTFQSLARLHPALLTDIYFQQSSQDRYTVFTPLYALVIEWLGARDASMDLVLVLSAALLAAAWGLARQLVGPRLAWPAAAVVAFTAGTYGANGVFHVSESFLSARLPAEALVVAALAAHYAGARALGFVLAFSAFLFHPLMALPGILLLGYLSVPSKFGLAGAAACLLGALGLCGAVMLFPALRAYFPVLDPAWLEVVRERSQFLFLEFWGRTDWEANLLPFVSLTLSVLVLDEPRLRRHCIGAMLVAATGLGIALIAGSLGPVALLLQGQAWRWVWCQELLTLLLLVPTALRVWRDPRVGPLCALAIVAAFTFPEIDPLLLAGFALALWMLRGFVDQRVATLLKGAALLGALGIVCWTLANVSLDVHTVQVTSARQPRVVLALRNILGLGVPSLAVAVLLPWWLFKTRGMSAPLGVLAALSACLVYASPSAFVGIGMFGTPSQIRDFADWRAAIDPTSAVFVADGRNEGSFVWFTLERPNYMFLGQSAGAVFSAAVAAEIRRRSDVLLPLVDPDWRILTEIRHMHDGKLPDKIVRPLTAQNLAAVCRDPTLGFVISKESVEVAHLTHERADEWKDWNLYDCRSVRTPEPRA